MPYFNDPNLEDDQDKQKQQQQQQQQGFAVSGAAPSPGGGGQGVASGSQALKTGSGFQNLDKYITANQGNQLGQNLLGKVSGEVNDASQNMAKASDQFKNQVNSANNLPTGDQITSVLNNAGTPNANASDADQYKTWLNQTYQGPKSLADNSDTWNQYWGKANQANASAQALGSEPGRFTLLDQYFGRPAYDFGEKSLDNLLVQNSGLGSQTQALQNQANALQGQGATQAKALQGVASARQGEVTHSADAARSALGIDANGQVITGDGAGALGQDYASNDAATAAVNAKRTQDYQDTMNTLATGTAPGPVSGFLQTAPGISNALATQLGLSNGQNLADLNINDYLTQGAALNESQALTPDQRARLVALSQLAGLTPDPSLAQAPTDANPNAYGFDLSRFQTDAAARQAALKQQQLLTATLPIYDAVNRTLNVLPPVIGPSRRGGA